jgi:hypothetical protein
LLNRLSAKDELIKEVQANNQVMVEIQSKIAEEKLNHKMMQSLVKTEAIRQAQKEKLQAHGKKLRKALSSVQQKNEYYSKTTEEKIQKKMEASMEIRQSCLQGLKERMHEKNLNVDQKRQTLDEILNLQKKMYEENYQQKMEKYHENRTGVFRAKKELLDAHFKHVERVCLLAKELKRAQKG